MDTYIEFRPSIAGRYAYLKGSRLKVWWVVHTAKTCFNMDARATAEHFQRPIAWIEAAMDYYTAFPEEIDQAIEEHLSMDVETLKRDFPNLKIITVPLEEFETEG